MPTVHAAVNFQLPFMQSQCIYTKSFIDYSLKMHKIGIKQKIKIQFGFKFMLIIGKRSEYIINDVCFWH